MEPQKTITLQPWWSTQQPVQPSLNWTFQMDFSTSAWYTSWDSTYRSWTIDSSLQTDISVFNPSFLLPCDLIWGVKEGLGHLTLLFQGNHRSDKVINTAVQRVFFNPVAISQNILRKPGGWSLQGWDDDRVLSTWRVLCWCLRWRGAHYECRVHRRLHLQQTSIVYYQQVRYRENYVIKLCHWKLCDWESLRFNFFKFSLMFFSPLILWKLRDWKSLSI